ncbi:MAG: von Willebrand factor type A domain-containing protein [Saprospiraceae bacterium]|nr:von Willebrand factor type A domain-containing protein [Saprospiraceae bacterium]
MSIIKNICVLCLMISLSNAVFSQNTVTIRGLVTEDATGEPVIGADVLLKQEGALVQGVATNLDGFFSITNVNPGTYDLEVNYLGMDTHKEEGISLEAGKTRTINISLREQKQLLESVVVASSKKRAKTRIRISKKDITHIPTTINNMEPLLRYTEVDAKTKKELKFAEKDKTVEKAEEDDGPLPKREPIKKIENPYYKTAEEPVSTFSIDVDQASYTRVEYSLQNNQKPDKEGIRLEEMINYFDYDYAAPKPNDPHPFAMHTELASCPWNKEAKLLQIGIQGVDELPKDLNAKNNLVFLVDVSGSMSSDLQLLKKSLRLMVDKLDKEDRVAIAVYAGAAGLVLPSTAVKDKAKILNSLDKLSSGGSTNGGEGIHLAYKVAQENFDKNANNRVILVTDGDFNVGVSSHSALEKLIEEKRKTNVFLTVLGMGYSSYGDKTMETLANKGNGVYMQINTQEDAKKVIEEELYGNLYTIAKDVKIQLEFDDEMVASYRLIGYVNRVLNKEDFDDDTKDAGELGLDHNVTALYELKFHENADPKKAIAKFNLRYKKPSEDKSQLIEHQIINPKQIPSLENASQNMRFASAVAAWGMLMMDSKHIDNKQFYYKKLITLAKNAKGKDVKGYRADCIELMKKSQELSKKLP